MVKWWRFCLPVLKRQEVGSIPGWERSPGGRNGNPLKYSSLKIPWTEDPGRLQSMGSQRLRHDQVAEHVHEWAYTHTHTYTHAHTHTYAHTHTHIYIETEHSKRLRGDARDSRRKLLWILKQAFILRSYLMSARQQRRPMMRASQKRTIYVPSTPKVRLLLQSCC